MRRLQVDWNALHSAFQMNMPEVRCFFSLEDGTVLKLPPGDQGIAVAKSQPDNFRAIDAVPSRIQYQWLDTYIKTIEDDTLRERLLASINGKGAFRRFKDILLTLPDERRRWFEYRDIAMRDRIVEWVREQGVEPIDPPSWSESESESASTNGIDGPAAPTTNQRDVEALRDFMIVWVDDWAEATGSEAPLNPLEVERLAQAISEAFRIKPAK